MLTPLFLEAANKAKRLAPEETEWDHIPRSSTGRLFIHWEYHPRDVGRRAIRQMFEETLAPALSEAKLTARRLTVAYSTPQNLAQCLTKTQLSEPDGIRVSDHIGLAEQQSANL